MGFRCLMIALALLVAFASDSFGRSKEPRFRSNPSAHDQLGTDQAPFAVKILPAPDAEKQERDGKEKAETDRKLALETQRIADFTLWLAAFTAGLLAVALAQAGLFLWQLRYMRRGMKDTENAARAANDAATAAKEQVETAKAQIEVTKIGIFDLERAYLDGGPKEIITGFVMDSSASGIYQQGDAMEVVVKIGMMNTGRTRAAITRAYGEFSQAANLGEEPTYNFLIGTNYVTDVSMAANVADTFPHDFKTRYIGEQFVFGFIAYKDIFKKTHTSRFCMRVFPALENGKSGKLQFAGNDRWRECD
jgi:hypothetical protein